MGSGVGVSVGVGDGVMVGGFTVGGDIIQPDIRKITMQQKKAFAKCDFIVI